MKLMHEYINAKQRVLDYSNDLSPSEAFKVGVDIGIMAQISRVMGDEKMVKETKTMKKALYEFFSFKG